MIEVDHGLRDILCDRLTYQEIYNASPTLENADNTHRVFVFECSRQPGFCPGHRFF